MQEAYCIIIIYAIVSNLLPVIVVPTHCRRQPRKTVFSHYSVCKKSGNIFYSFDQYKVNLNVAKVLLFKISPVCICGFRLDRRCA